ncbi:MAG: DUF3800 domain-containing protein [Bryobacteraceae bacterium]
MAFFLFVDERGHDLRASPYEVLAGVSVQDRDLWNLISAIKEAELLFFGLRYSYYKEEFKGKKFLKTKVFRLSRQADPIPADERRELAKAAIERGDDVKGHMLTALSQAKLGFVQRVFELCVNFNCHAFASVVPAGAPRPSAGLLRKDYVFLFERFFYYLEDQRMSDRGVIVFDEIEKVKSKILIDQMESYFLQTSKGRARARQIIPEPFFVHSDLTTLIQVADLIAYVTAWGYRFSRRLTAPAREELQPFARQLRSLGYYTERERDENPRFPIYSFCCIEDLRGKAERNKPENRKGNEAAEAAPKPPGQT